MLGLILKARRSGALIRNVLADTPFRRLEGAGKP